MSHTVEKISGSSMAAFDAVLDNIILKPEPRARYNRILVVPAYKGITDALLESKKNSEPGVYHYALDGSNLWESKLDSVLQRLLLVNESVFADPMVRRKADDFIIKRTTDTRRWIRENLSSKRLQTKIREQLAAIGEVHSAYNTALKAKRYGVQTKFIDLADSSNDSSQSFDTKVRNNLADVDLSCELPVVAAYSTHEINNTCQHDRRYGDLTLSRIAAITDAKQAIIHKSHHLSSGDPILIGEGQVSPMSNSNYQVVNQLSALSNDVVHPAAIAELSEKNIDLHMRCTFEPEHPGTFISRDHCSTEHKVELVSGKEDVCSLKVELKNHSTDLNQLEKQLQLQSEFNLLHKYMKGNVAHYYFNCEVGHFGAILTKVKKLVPDSDITIQQVALLSVLGSKIEPEKTLLKGCHALERNGIKPLHTYKSENKNSVKFVVSSAHYRASSCALHDAFLQS
ncbi:aspartate kinase [Vibrio sp. Isolate30]|uniref:amino acid kinase family protein n=1 Tax=Vibrio sp. Isolate30 TaxID=2908536 RepID=UPI001EFCEF78|nr:aspartate kinase [Vibrio sp. Isolate30]MCG9633109.1 aspartate kinase [Vibrio sp. Isolate30]